MADIVALPLHDLKMLLKEIQEFMRKSRESMTIGDNKNGNT